MIAVKCFNNPKEPGFSFGLIARWTQQSCRQEAVLFDATGHCKDVETAKSSIMIAHFETERNVLGLGQGLRSPNNLFHGI